MNKKATKSPMTLNEIGMDALSKVFSPVEVARFLRLYDKGNGNYTKDREHDLEGISMSDIRSGIKALRERL